MARSKLKKVTVMLFKSTKFLRLLERMRDRYTKEGEAEDLVVPYVLLCALTLESKLNDALTYKATRLCKGGSNALEDAFCSMSFRGKLNALVPVLTNGRYRINNDHFVYQRLASLISVRNQLAHARSQYEDIKYSEDEVPPDFPKWLPYTPKAYVERAEDITLDASHPFTPLEYHEAIERLEKWFFRRCPDKLKHVDLVRLNDDV